MITEKQAQRAINWLLLEQYLISLYRNNGIRYFTIGFIDETQIYIHPEGVNGETIDFKIEIPEYLTTQRGNSSLLVAGGMAPNDT